MGSLAGRLCGYGSAAFPLTRHQQDPLLPRLRTLYAWAARGGLAPRVPLVLLAGARCQTEYTPRMPLTPDLAGGESNPRADAEEGEAAGHGHSLFFGASVGDCSLRTAVDCTPCRPAGPVCPPPIAQLQDGHIHSAAHD